MGFFWSEYVPGLTVRKQSEAPGDGGRSSREGIRGCRAPPDGTKSRTTPPHSFSSRGGSRRVELHAYRRTSRVLYFFRHQSTNTDTDSEHLSHSSPNNTFIVYRCTATSHCSSSTPPTAQHSLPHRNFLCPNTPSLLSFPSASKHGNWARPLRL